MRPNSILRRTSALILAGMMMTGASAWAAEADSTASGSAAAYIQAAESENTEASWEIDKVYNTPKGIMIKCPEMSGGAYPAKVYYKRTPDGSDRYTIVKSSSRGKTTYLDKKCKNGRMYEYKVVDMTSGGYVYASNEVKIYRLTQPTIKSLHQTKSTAKLSWTRNSKADGYEIAYAPKSRFKNQPTKIIIGNSNTTAKLKDLNTNVSYGFKVRSYKTVDGTTYYSAWSSIAKQVGK